MKKFDFAPKAQYEAKYASIEQIAQKLGQTVQWRSVKQLMMPALEAFEANLKGQLPTAHIGRLEQVRQQVKAGVTSPKAIADAIDAHPSYVWRLVKQVLAEKPKRRNSRSTAKQS